MVVWYLTAQVTLGFRLSNKLWHHTYYYFNTHIYTSLNHLPSAHHSHVVYLSFSSSINHFLKIYKHLNNHLSLHFLHLVSLFLWYIIHEASYVIVIFIARAPPTHGWPSAWLQLSPQKFMIILYANYFTINHSSLYHNIQYLGILWQFRIWRRKKREQEKCSR